MTESSWKGCYDGGWMGVITPTSFAHPAKMSKPLLERIIRHGLEQGYWKAGDTIGDPFFGIGSTGIIGAYNGLKVIGVELEPKFHALCLENFELHRRKWETLGAPMPVALLGDSRQFASIVAGELDGCVTSPPFTTDQPCASQTKALKDYHAFTRGDGTKRDKGMLSDGNIAALPAGSLSGVVTSPPFADKVAFADKKFEAEHKKGVTADQYEKKPYDKRGFLDPDYAENAATCNLGSFRDCTPTYWSACRAVYDQVRLALKPGGVFCLVLKSYVSKGRLVDLPAQTCTLLTALGFDVFELTRAWLVKEEKHPGLFGEEVVKTKAKKSFFRRLAEKRGSPPIDFEVVLWARKQQ